MISTQLRLARRNAMRRKVRTLLTAGMVVAGVSLLLLLVTWIDGASSTMLASATATGGHVRVVDKDYAAREQLAPLEEHVPEVAPLVELLREQPGVTAVEPRITSGVSVTVGEEIGEVFARVIGARVSYFERQMKAKEKLVEGAWFTGKDDEMIAGYTVAKDAGAKVGDELVLLGVTQDGSLSPVKGRLVGIVRGDSEVNQAVLASLPTLQWLTDIQGGATEVLVYGDDYKDAAELAASLRPVPQLADYAVEAWLEREPWKSLNATMVGMQSMLILVVVLLVALGIWNTMMMSVLERTHEIGVLRALGMTRLATVGLLVGEALAIGVLGGLAGVGLGAIPSWLLEKNGIHLGEQVASGTDLAIAETIYGDLTLFGVVLSFTLGLAMALLGSLLPAFRAASIQPVTAMRSGR